MTKPLLTLAAALILLPALLAAATQDDADAVYSRALMHKSDGNFDKAIEVFTTLIPSGKELDHLYYQIASCYSSKTDYAQAQSFARKAIEVNPSFVDPYQLIYDINFTLKNYEAAADILEDLTEANPGLIQFQYAKGTLYYQNIQNYPMAEASMRKVLAIAAETSAPTSYKEQSHLILSEIGLQRKDYDMALDELDAAVAINPRNSARYYRLASYFISASSLDSARRAIEKFIPSVPADQKNSALIRTMHAYLGNIYYITDDPRALEYLRLGSGSDNIDCFTAKYIFAATTGQTDEAAPVLEKVMTEYPKYVTPSIALGRIALNKGDSDKAYTCFLSAAQLLYKTDMPSAAVLYYLKALQIKPEMTDINLIIGQLYENMDLNAAAILRYQAYHAAKPDVEIPLHIAYLFDLEKDRTRSDAWLAKAQAGWPGSARVPFFRGVLATKADRNAEAEKDFEKSIAIKNDDPSSWFYLAVSREKQERFDGAIEAMKKALELDPENASYMNFLGYLYADRNVNLKDAESLLSKALDKDPFNGAYLDSLGWIYYRQGRYELAIAKLTQARRALAAADSQDAVVYSHLGDAFLKAGLNEKSRSAFQRSYELKKDPIVKRKIDSIK